MSDSLKIENARLLVDGKEAFERVIDRIKNAKRHIRINMFIWRDDRIGDAIAAELLLAADRGIRVELTKDLLGAVFEKSEENKQSFFHKRLSWRTYLKEWAVGTFYGTPGEASLAKQMRAQKRRQAWVLSKLFACN